MFNKFVQEFSKGFIFILKLSLSILYIFLKDKLLRYLSLYVYGTILFAKILINIKQFKCSRHDNNDFKHPIFYY